MSQKLLKTTQNIISIFIGILYLTTCSSSSSAERTVSNGKIIFQKSLNSDAEFFTMNSEGSEVTKIDIKPPKEDPSLKFSDICFPTYSFSGEMIAFLKRNDEFSSSLYIMKSDGSEVKILATNVDGGLGFAFSHDDKRIIFRDFRFFGMSELYSVDIEASEISIFDSKCYKDPKFTSDGKYLICKAAPIVKKGPWKLELFHAKTGKYISDIETSGLYQASVFSISFDCKYIVYTACLSSQRQIIIMDFNGRNKKINFSSNHHLLDYITWSPDGKSLLIHVLDEETNDNYFSIINLGDVIDGNLNYIPTVMLNKNEKSVSLSWQPIFL